MCEAVIKQNTVDPMMTIETRVSMDDPSVSRTLCVAGTS